VIKVSHLLMIQSLISPDFRVWNWPDWGPNCTRP